jgi:glucose/arabinose dehydrogenase
VVAVVALAMLVLAPSVAASPMREPAGVAPNVVAGAPTSARIKLSLRASGLTRPVFVASARDATARLFIVEQGGKIKVWKDFQTYATPFLNISSQVSKGGEQGLLGLAFHPSFKTNRKLYVNFTDLNGDTVIREYKVSSTNPNVVATSTARTILKISQPYDNHNGGSLAFGPDGYLYIGMGDGGSSGDPGNRAQNKDSLLGKMLRINVNSTTSTTNYTTPTSNPYYGVAGRNEIWQIGLRNPWKFSFDRANGNIWIGDVGQGKWEEIDRGLKTSSGAARKANWGWRLMEGMHCYNPSSGCNTTGLWWPLLEYAHDNGRCSVTGGYVYRGKNIPVLVGGYVFADYCSGEIWVIDSAAARPAPKTLLLDTDMTITSFGEGGSNELYVLDHGGGRLYAILGA